MPGLLRGVARAAVIVRNRNRRQQPRLPPPGAALGRAGARSRLRPTQQPPPQAPAPAADPIEQLTKLGELRDKGVLTEEEFAAQKAKILG